MNISKDDFAEANRQIDSILHKLSQTIQTLEAKEHAQKYKSQITLAKRRRAALEIANVLIRQQLER